MKERGVDVLFQLLDAAGDHRGRHPELARRSGKTLGLRDADERLNAQKCIHGLNISLNLHFANNDACLHLTPLDNPCSSEADPPFCGEKASLNPLGTVVFGALHRPVYAPGRLPYPECCSYREREMTAGCV